MFTTGVFAVWGGGVRPPQADSNTTTVKTPLRTRGSLPRKATSGTLRIVLAFAMISGCVRTRRLDPDLLTPQLITRSGTNVRVLSHPHGMTTLSLWIDAGSLDAKPPQVAVVAAWIAEERLGPGGAVEVTADGTELRLPCANRSTTACLRRLADALGTRSVPPATLEAKLDALRKERLRAQKQERHASDRYALDALFAQRAGLFPLGDADTDVEVTRDAIGIFLANHYGPNRALLIGSGPLEPEELRDLADDAFASIPVAHRAPRRRKLAVEPRVVVETGDRAAATWVGLVESLERAAQIAESATRWIADRAPAAEITTQGVAYPLRAGSLVFVRVAGDSVLEAPTFALAAHAFVAALAEEARSASWWPASAGGLDAAARFVGRRWVTRRGADEERPHPPIGLGVSVPTTPDPRALTSVRERIEQAWASERHSLFGQAETLDGDHPTLTLENGSRIEATRWPTPHVAIVAQWDTGSASETATGHGTTALLSTAASASCGSLTASALADRLRRIGANLVPYASPDRWGLALRAPAASWREAIDLAGLCIVAPRFDRTSLEHARISLAAQLRHSPESRMRATWVARLLRTDRPGLVAPYGSVEAVMQLAPATVRQRWQDARTGSNLRVAVVGRVPLRQATVRMAHRVAELPRDNGRPRSERSIGEAETRISFETILRIEEAPESAGTVLIAWGTTSTPSNPTVAFAARAFASAAAAALRNRAGVAVTWHGGDVSAAGAWAAVAVSMPEVQRSRLPEVVSDAVHSAAPTLESWVERFHLEQAQAIDASAAARLLLTEQPGDADEKSLRDKALEVAQALSQTAPSYALGYQKSPAEGE